jgi:hypothetical protein
MTRLLEIDQVAELLSIHPQSVRELIWADEIAWVNISTGKRPRIRVADHEVERFIKKRTVKSSKRPMSAVA